jgi:deoxyribose-phosphate aldolase
MTTYAPPPRQASGEARTGVPLPAHLSDATADEATLKRFLSGLPGVDPVGLELRAASLATRSIKKASKLAAIDLAISMVDLTTLEGADTPGKVRNLARKALSPDPNGPVRPAQDDASTGPGNVCPAVAAVCVYPDRVATAADEVAGSGVKVASVATAFPSGRSSLEVKLADTRLALESGADEIDMVIDRGAFLAGQYGLVLEQIRAVKAVVGGSGRARLKVILETGELATYDNVRRACWIALLGGADFLKTSTGKVSPAATLPVTQVLLQAVRDWRDQTGQQVAVKPAGGIRTTKDAIRHLVAVNEIAGPEWLDPHWFRFGASSLLDDLVLQRRAQLDGHYADPATVPLD